MRLLFKFLLMIAVSFPVASNAQFLDFFSNGTSEDLQHDFDIAKLNALETLLVTRLR